MSTEDQINVLVKKSKGYYIIVTTDVHCIQSPSQRQIVAELLVWLVDDEIKIFNFVEGFTLQMQ